VEGVKSCGRGEGRESSSVSDGVMVDETEDLWGWAGYCGEKSPAQVDVHDPMAACPHARRPTPCSSAAAQVQVPLLWQPSTRYLQISLAQVSEGGIDHPPPKSWYAGCRASAGDRCIGGPRRLGSSS